MHVDFFVMLASTFNFLNTTWFDKFRIFIRIDYMFLYTLYSKINLLTSSKTCLDLESWHIITWLYQIFYSVREEIICLGLNFHHFNGIQLSYFHFEYLWLQFCLKFFKKLFTAKIFSSKLNKQKKKWFIFFQLLRWFLSLNEIYKGLLWLPKVLDNP